MNKKINVVFILLIMISRFLSAADIIRVESGNKHLLPKGKEVDGMIGDWIMKNDKVIAVIADAYSDREANQMVSSIQGAVIDFTTLAANNDQLVVYYPQGARVDIPAADTIIVLQKKGKIVQLQAVRYPSEKEPYTIKTTYILQDGKSYIEVVTEYNNTSSAGATIKLSDRLRCDNDLTDISPAGEGILSFIYNKWFNSAYGISTPKGKLLTREMPKKPALTDVGVEVFYPANGTLSTEPIQLGAGQKISISRVLMTGNDIADVQKQFSVVSGQSAVDWRVQAIDKKSVNIAGAFVYAKNDKGELVSAATTDQNGSAFVMLDKGEYKLTLTKLGHDTVSQTVTVPGNKSSSVLTMQAKSGISVNVSGPDGKTMPVKVELRGQSGTRDPFLGPFKRANGAGNLYFSNTKKFEIPVPPGTYDVAISHGPEYDVVLKTVTVNRGELPLIEVMMQRSYTTPNWITSDMHNHTTGSGDTNSEVEGRVLNLAASGIEFAPATEHNRISTFTPTIAQMGLQKFIASCPGVELSGRPGPGDINHQNGWPVRIQDGMRGYGAPKTDRDPYVQMKRLYDYDGGKFKMMQQNHPNIGWLYFDKDRDGVADNGFGTAPITYAMEINGTLVDFPRILNGEKTRSRLLPWLQMLNLGYHIYGTANSDSHVVSHASGSVFSYIYTENDAPEKVNADELAQQVKNGHVVISNGPFMDVRINGALPGDDVKAENGKVTAKVKVMAANWCRVNTVQVVVNGRADQSYVFTKEKNPEMFLDGPAVFEKEFSLTLNSDAHLIVIAYGKGETVGKVQGSAMRNAIPIVMSNPVFVDVDGNGFQANKDLLDSPLPTAKPVRGIVQPSEDND